MCIMEYKILNDLNEDIIALRHETFVLGRGVPPEVEIDGRDPEHMHFCIYDGEVLVAYLRAEDLGGMLHVGRVAVNAEKRKNGYGRLLFDWVYEYAAKSDIAYIEVSAVKTAQGFYEKIGFVSEGNYYLETGVPHIYMKKVIK